MPGHQHPPTTPSPKSGRTGKITDFFKSVHQSEPRHTAKRELDVEDHDAQPAKKLKQSDDGHAGSIKTARSQVAVHTTTPRKPASARLLDHTDGGLRESLIGRWEFEETSAEDNGPVGNKKPKSSSPTHTPVTVVKPPRTKPASSRLLDDTDGGLSDRLVGRFETPRYEEGGFEHGEEKRIGDLTHNIADHKSEGDNTLDDDTEAETEIEDNEVDNSGVNNTGVDRSDDDNSSDGNGDEDDNDEDSDEGEDSEGDDSDKENVDPRDRSRAPSPPSLPATPGNHGNHSHDTAESTPSNQPSDSPSSFLLPSPVVDLPPLPSSSSSSSTLVPEHPSTLPSPPSSP